VLVTLALALWLKAQPAWAQPSDGMSAAVVRPDVVARLGYVFARESGHAGAASPEEEGGLLARNSEAFLRANVRVALGNEWRGFVYADIGAADSELRWQGLAGVHHRLGVDLLGGWRHVTYHFAPGHGFDSLEFKGPFLGAAFAW